MCPFIQEWLYVVMPLYIAPGTAAYAGTEDIEPSSAGQIDALNVDREENMEGGSRHLKISPQFCLHSKAKTRKGLLGISSEPGDGFEDKCPLPTYVFEPFDVNVPCDDFVIGIYLEVKIIG